MHLKQKYLLGVDIGTSQLKCTLVRADGFEVFSSSKELVTRYPFPGWSEQNPEDWYELFCRLCHEIISESKVNVGWLASICVTGTAHTHVLLGADGEVLRPAIMWTDQRSSQEAIWLNQNWGERIFDITYHKVNPTWTLPQLLWVKRNEPVIYEKTQKLMLAKDYLRYRITGSWQTDWIDALGTLMFDAEKRQWSDEICKLIDWPKERLPNVVSPTAVVGAVTFHAAADCGLLEGTPVVAGTSDTAAEAYGVGAVFPGQGVIKLATAGNTNIMSERPHSSSILFNYYHVIPGMWYTVAATNSCASAHRWLRDTFFYPDKVLGEKEKNNIFERMDNLARSVPLGSGGLLFHPYLLGERTPYWDPLLRADFIGITMRHGKGHFVRALYEGIAFSLRDCHESLASEGLSMQEVRLIGGGSRSTLWRRIVCDVLGLTILKPGMDDAGFGVALLGGVGVGIYRDERDAVEKCVKIISADKPDMENHDRYSQLFHLYKKSQKYLAELNHELHDFESTTPS